MAVCDNFGGLSLIDIASKSSMKLKSHRERCCAMDFYGDLLASGSRDKGILINDIRTPNKKIQALAMHSDEICGVKWSPDGRFLASGSANCMLSIWDTRMNKISLKSTAHKSAIRAIA